MHLAYTIVMYLLIPVILYRLALRGFRAPAYFRRWPERFGFFPEPGFTSSIWIHAVSMGEVNAAIPLIRALMKRYPEHQFVITTVTPTGSERVESVFGETVFHVYLPYDLPAAVRRFLDRTRPRLAVVMETEIWPNLFCACRDRDIPIVVANARLSERSLRGYRPVQGLAATALNCSTRVGAQTQTDAQRLLRLGGEPAKIEVVGSLKFDLQLAPELPDLGRELRDHWGSDRFAFVAASTHEDDEVPVMKAFERLLETDPRALLVLVPRHPERFPRAAARCRSLGYETALRSEDINASPDTQCFVVDTMGELLRFYAAADVAFVGGSLAYVGGHNVLEPAALGLPVLVGPHTFNFSEITELLLDRGGAERVHDADELATELRLLRQDETRRRRMGDAAFTLVKENRGALQHTLRMIEEAFEPAATASPARPERGVKSEK
ncbi:MAG: lipid IV(A) 3-deoxy-D-manno-octulosonic acid transferase [Xanthomonadales bacterium]|nr:lipid IV(A) 3-deoxy-D-manno-octulosonic acid transferase [Xanthomonadales bacterium]